MTDPQTARDRIAFLRGLRNIRQYRSDPIPQPIVDDILDVARWSGSARNLQPWEFVVVRDRETLRTMGAADGYVAHLTGAPLAIVLVMHGVPTQLTQETWDEGRLAERIMLAADAHGLVSSIAWYGGPTATAASEILGIPDGRLVRTLISIGYPDRDANAATPSGLSGRKPLPETVHYDRW